MVFIWEACITFLENKLIWWYFWLNS